jgi:hypothetical protein
MKTVQMTLDENLIASVDKVAKRLGTTRSAFTRQALKTALREARMNELERKHREGYKRKPVKQGEFGIGRQNRFGGNHEKRRSSLV